MTRYWVGWLAGYEGERRGGWHHPESFTKRVAPTNKDSGVPYDRKQLFQVAVAAKVAVPPTEKYNSGLWTDPIRCIWGLQSVYVIAAFLILLPDPYQHVSIIASQRGDCHPMQISLNRCLLSIEQGTRTGTNPEPPDARNFLN